MDLAVAINKVPILNLNNCYFSAVEPKLEKNNGALFYQTLKVKGMKRPLVFTIFEQGLRYSLFTFSVNHINEVPSSNQKDGYIPASEKKLKR